MAFCMKCGKKLAEGAAFCANCGTAVGTAGTGRKQEYVNTTIKKCPNCGEVIPNGLVTKCPSCGFELNRTEVAKGIKTLVDELKENPYRTKEIVENYVVPNNKEDMIEFILFATARGSEELEKAKRSDTAHENVSDTSFYAFAEKAIVTIEKANMLFSNDTSFLDSLNQKKAELNRLKKEMSMVVLKSKKKANKKDAIESTKDNAKGIFTIILRLFIPILGAIFIAISAIIEGGIRDGITANFLGKIGLLMILGFGQYKLVVTHKPEGVISAGAAILIFTVLFLFLEDFMSWGMMIEQALP